MMPSTTYFSLLGFWLVLTVLLMFAVPVARAADGPQKGDSVQMMEAFDQACHAGRG